MAAQTRFSATSYRTPMKFATPVTAQTKLLKLDQTTSNWTRHQKLTTLMPEDTLKVKIIVSTTSGEDTAIFTRALGHGFTRDWTPDNPMPRDVVDLYRRYVRYNTGPYIPPPRRDLFTGETHGSHSPPPQLNNTRRKNKKKSYNPYNSTWVEKKGGHAVVMRKEPTPPIPIAHFPEGKTDVPPPGKEGEVFILNTCTQIWEDVSKMSREVKKIKKEITKKAKRRSTEKEEKENPAQKYKKHHWVKIAERRWGKQKKNEEHQPQRTDSEEEAKRDGMPPLVPATPPPSPATSYRKVRNFLDDLKEMRRTENTREQTEQQTQTAETKGPETNETADLEDMDPDINLYEPYNPLVIDLDYTPKSPVYNPQTPKKQTQAEQSTPQAVEETKKTEEKKTSPPERWIPRETTEVSQVKEERKERVKQLLQKKEEEDRRRRVQHFLTQTVAQQPCMGTTVMNVKHAWNQENPPASREANRQTAQDAWERRRQELWHQFQHAQYARTQTQGPQGGNTVARPHSYWEGGPLLQRAQVNPNPHQNMAVKTFTPIVLFDSRNVKQTPKIKETLL